MDDLKFLRKTYINVPAEKVWEAIITPEIVSKYYLCPLNEIDLVVGGEMMYMMGEQRAIYARITDLEEGKKLCHTFAFTSETHKDVDGDKPTAVTYEIWPMGEMSLLELTHSEFPEMNQTWQNVIEGWHQICSNLKTYLETGETLPWPKQ